MLYKFAGSNHTATDDVSTLLKSVNSSQTIAEYLTRLKKNVGNLRFLPHSHHRRADLWVDHIGQGEWASQVSHSVKPSLTSFALARLLRT